MNAHPQRQIILLRLGLIASSSILVLWLVSTRWTFGYTQYGLQATSFTARAGVLQTYTPPSASQARWLTLIQRGWRGRRLQWETGVPVTYLFGLTTPAIIHHKFGTIQTLPMWLPFSIVATPTLLLWYTDYRRKRAATSFVACTSCNYDLTGNSSGICPECGTSIQPVTQLPPPVLCAAESAPQST